jgi:3-dehydroquinate dehydratase
MIFVSPSPAANTHMLRAEAGSRLRAVREVHISNVHAPGECQRHSMPSSTGVIRGSGPYGYITAMQTTARMK